MNLRQIVIKKNLCWVSMAGFLSLFLSACSDDNGHLNSAVQNKNTPVISPVIATVNVKNALAYELKNEAVSVELTQLGIGANTQGENFSFYLDDQKIPHQFIDSNNDGMKDQVLMLLDLSPDATVNISMKANKNSSAHNEKRTHAEISVKTGGRWNEKKYEGGVFENVSTVTTPSNYTDHSEYIRYEGPGIESENIGYRVYLDWRNGFDIFGKKKQKLHLSKVGLDGYQSYHEAADWGMDILKVGKSVGLGGFGLWKNGSIERLSDVKQWTATIVEDGDLYSAFSIDYQDWNTGTEKVNLSTQLSMQAGSSVASVNIKTDPVIETLAVGIVKHKDAKVLRGSLDVTGEAWSYVATLGPQALDGQQLLMFVLFKREIFKEFVDDDFNHGLLLNVRNGELHYQFGAHWAGEPNSNLSLSAVKKILKKEIERRTFSPRLSISNDQSDTFKAKIGGIDNALQWSKLAAESEIKRHGKELAYGQFDTMRERMANWEYTTGMMAQSVYLVGKATNDQGLKDWGKYIIDSYLNDAGDIKTYDIAKYNIDSVNSGKMLLELYKDTGDEKYRTAASHLRQQLKDHPRLDLGVFWHKKRYPYQLWLDGVYMGMPFLAEYTVLFEDGEALDEVIKEFHVTRDYLRDPTTGLYFHAFDEKKVQNWADPETGLSHYFWARGMGWLAMAIVDTLDFIPQHQTQKRQELTEMAVELIDALMNFQNENGVWHQIVNMREDRGNYPEASSSSMYTYLLIKGVSKGILPQSYSVYAEKSYQALIDEFILVDSNNNVILTQNCQVGGLGYGRDGSYEYYMSEPIVDNDPKGLAPFITLGLYATDSSIN